MGDGEKMVLGRGEWGENRNGVRTELDLFYQRTHSHAVLTRNEKSAKCRVASRMLYAMKMLYHDISKALMMTLIGF